MGDLRFATPRSVMVLGPPRGRVAGRVDALAVSGDGRHAVVTHRSWDRTTDHVTRCSLEDGRCEPLAGAPWAWAERNRYVAAPTGRVFDDREDAAVRWRDPDGRGGSVPRPGGESAPAVSPDGSHVVLARARGTALRVVRVDDGAERCAATLREAWLPSSVVVCDGFVAGVTGRGDLQRVRFADGDVRAVAIPTSSELPSCAVDCGAARVAVAAAGWARVYELDTLREAASVAVAPDARLLDFAAGRLLVFEPSEGPRPIAVRDLETVEVWRPWAAPSAERARLTRDGRRVVYVAEGWVRALDVGSGRDLGVHDGPEASVGRLAWSHDSALVAAVCGAGVVRVLDVSRGEVAWTPEGGPASAPEAGAPLAAFSPDGRELYGIAASEVVTWSLVTGHEIGRAEGASDGAAMLDAALSPDGRLLAVAARHGAGRRGPARLTTFDVAAGMRRLGSWDLPAVFDANESTLRFQGAAELRWFVRHGLHRGSAATYRLGLDGRELGVERVGLRSSLQAHPMGDHRVVLRDVEGLLVGSLSGRRPSVRRVVPGCFVESLLDARDGFVAFAVRALGPDGCIVAESSADRLVAVAEAEGAGAPVVMAVASGVGFAALSPGARHLAVRRGDGAVEVFALGRGPR